MEHGNRSSFGTLIIDESKWNEQTFVDSEDCRYMKIKPLNFMTELRTLQGSELTPVVKQKGGKQSQRRRFKVMEKRIP